MNLNKINTKQIITLAIVLAIFALLATIPLFGSSYSIIRFIYFFMYIILSVAWAIFSGTTGYISLASAAFFGIGIYAAALLSETLPLIVIVIIGGLASFIIAFLVGSITLRLKGIYFAMFTFGLVLLIKEVLYYCEINIFNVRGLFVKVYSDNTIYYYLLGILVVLMLTAFFIKRSKFGMALQGIGENEEAAVHIGINVTMVKVLTYSVSALFAGAAGVIMAIKYTYIDPGIAFNPMLSFSPVLMAIFGGLGTLYGPVIGSVIFTYLQEVLTTGKFRDYYMLIFGIVLVAAIMYMPNGIIGLIQNIWKRITGARRAHS